MLRPTACRSERPVCPPPFFPGPQRIILLIKVRRRARWGLQTRRGLVPECKTVGRLLIRGAFLQPCMDCTRSRGTALVLIVHAITSACARGVPGIGKPTLQRVRHRNCCGGARAPRPFHYPTHRFEHSSGGTSIRLSPMDASMEFFRIETDWLRTGLVVWTWPRHLFVPPDNIKTPRPIATGTMRV